MILQKVKYISMLEVCPQSGENITKSRECQIVHSHKKVLQKLSKLDSPQSQENIIKV